MTRVHTFMTMLFLTPLLAGTALAQGANEVQDVEVGVKVPEGHFELAD